MATAATLANLERKAAFVDRVHFYEGVPLPGLIDCNVVELCNRSGPLRPKARFTPCTFCPRIDPKIYPNRNLKMSLDLARKLGDELRALNYQGIVLLCGFSEPMMHADLPGLIRELHGLRVELVTNGDFLTVAKLHALEAAGLAYVVVSCYDGPEQLPHFGAMFAEAGWHRDRYALRDRWQGADEDFGLILTNRAGMVTAGHQRPVDLDSMCFYPSYSVLIDTTGEVILCVNDWGKVATFGSIADRSLFDIWRSPELHAYRMALLEGRRGLTPCSTCNVRGILHGSAHAEAWLNL